MGLAVLLHETIHATGPEARTDSLTTKSGLAFEEGFTEAATEDLLYVFVTSLNLPPAVRGPLAAAVRRRAHAYAAGSGVRAADVAARHQVAGDVGEGAGVADPRGRHLGRQAVGSAVGRHRALREGAPPAGGRADHPGRPALTGSAGDPGAAHGGAQPAPAPPTSSSAQKWSRTSVPPPRARAPVHVGEVGHDQPPAAADRMVARRARLARGRGGARTAAIADAHRGDVVVHAQVDADLRVRHGPVLHRVLDRLVHGQRHILQAGVRPARVAQLGEDPLAGAEGSVGGRGDARRADRVGRAGGARGVGDAGVGPGHD